jgi:hypothetical protein
MLKASIKATAIAQKLDFDAARTAFEAAWREYLPKRSEVDFEEWRLDAAYHTAKYARWDARK